MTYSSWSTADSDIHDKNCLCMQMHGYFIFPQCCSRNQVCADQAQCTLTLVGAGVGACMRHSHSHSYSQSRLHSHSHSHSHGHSHRPTVTVTATVTAYSQKSQGYFSYIMKFGGEKAVCCKGLVFGDGGLKHVS